MFALAEMVHGVMASNVAFATVKVTAALCCPLAPAPAVSVRVPHLCFVGAVREARVHVGSATTIVPLVTGTPVHWNVSTTVPRVPAMGLLTITDATKDATTAVSMDVVLVVAEGLVAAPIVAAIVWVARFAAWLVAATPSCHICIG